MLYVLFLISLSPYSLWAESVRLPEKNLKCQAAELCPSAQPSTQNRAERGKCDTEHSQWMLCAVLGLLYNKVLSVKTLQALQVDLYGDARCCVQKDVLEFYYNISLRIRQNYAQLHLKLSLKLQYL